MDERGTKPIPEKLDVTLDRAAIDLQLGGQSTDRRMLTSAHGCIDLGETSQGRAG
jgi:hypothetical protein